MAKNQIKPPEGFVLDEPTDTEIKPPEGFVLDNPDINPSEVKPPEGFVLDSAPQERPDLPIEPPTVAGEFVKNLPGAYVDLLKSIKGRTESALAYEMGGAVKGATMGYVDPLPMLEQTEYAKEPIAKGAAAATGQLIGMAAPISAIARGVGMGMKSVEAFNAVRPWLSRLFQSAATGGVFGAAKKPEEGQSRVDNAVRDAGLFLAFEGGLLGVNRLFNKDILIPDAAKGEVTGKAMESWLDVYAKGGSKIKAARAFWKTFQDEARQAVEAAKSGAGAPEGAVAVPGGKVAASVVQAPTQFNLALKEMLRPIRFPNLKGGPRVVDTSAIPAAAPETAQTAPILSPQGSTYLKTEFPVLNEAIKATPQVTPEVITSAVAAGIEAKLSGATGTQAETAAVKVLKEGAAAIPEAPKPIEPNITDLKSFRQAILDAFPKETVSEEMANKMTGMVKRNVVLWSMNTGRPIEEGLQRMFGAIVKGETAATPANLGMAQEDLFAIQKESVNDRYKRYAEEGKAVGLKGGALHKYALDRLAAERRSQLPTDRPKEKQIQFMVEGGAKAFGSDVPELFQDEGKVNQMAQDLVGSRDAEEIDQKLDALFGTEAENAKIDAGESPDNIQHRLAARFRADLEHAAGIGDVQETSRIMNRMMHVIRSMGGKIPVDDLRKEKGIFWHGTDSADLRGAKNGLHVGTYDAAKQALEARIGIPAEGEWDGTREYGKTLLAGRKSIESGKYGEYRLSGFNADAPENDYYPTEVKHRATHGDRSEVSFESKPIIIPVKVVGQMGNTIENPKEDFKTNSLIARQITRGQAKSGYYYKNESEDYGSISAVVPSAAHLEIVIPKGVSESSSRPSAKFIGYQEDGEGGSFPLFNVEGNHDLNGSTVSEVTLKLNGIPMPEHPSFEEWKKSDEGKLYQEEKQAEINKPFFSQLQKTLEEKMPNRASAEQIKGIIGQGVKQEEIEWSGLNEFLAEQKGPIEKSAVLDFLKSNEVKVEEVVKGEPITTEEEALNYIADVDGISVESAKKQYYESEDQIIAYANDLKSDPNNTVDVPKFSQWQLPGGEFYRELLLTLPETAQPSAREAYDALVVKLDKKYGEGWSRDDVSTPELKELDRLWKRLNTPWQKDTATETTPPFKSSHFDEPNILAHVRFNDRTDADGNKVLFIEEVQSDWHQMGRSKGYRRTLTEAEQEQVKNLNDEIAKLQKEKEPIQKKINKISYKDNPKEWKAVSDEIVKISSKITTLQLTLSKFSDSGLVPDAPFKKTWHELALKRMLRYAVENGYDKIAWTTGEQQAARYDLSKQVDNIEWTLNKNGTYDVQVYVKDAINPTSLGKEIPESELPSYIGKEPAQRMVDFTNKNIEKAKTEGLGISGDNLKIGGEGMKGFYDKILPDFLRKYVKKWGATVSPVNVPSLKGKADVSSVFSFPAKDVGDFKESLPLVKKTDSGIEIVVEPGLFKSGKVKSGPSDPKALSDFLSWKTGGKKSFGQLPTPILLVMMSRMRALLHNPEIGKAVVRLIPVDVVNNLVGGKFSTEAVLNDPSVLADSFTIDHNADISAAQNHAMRAVVGAPTFPTTEAFFGSNDPMRWPSNFRSTSSAKDFHGIPPKKIVDSIIDFTNNQEVGETLGVTITPSMKESVMQGQPLFQKGGIKKASVEFMEDGRAIIRAFEKADFSSLVHEIGHVFRREMYRRLKEYKGDALEQLKIDIAEMEKFSGAKGVRWSIPADEKFARSFERYLITGKAPTQELQHYYDMFKDWMKQVYGSIKDTPIDIKLSPEIKGVFDRMFDDGYEYFENGEKVKKSEIVKRAQELAEQANEIRVEESALERFFRENPIKVSKEDLADYGDIAIRFRDNRIGRGLDERAEEARNQGLIPDGVDAEKYAYEFLTGIPERGGLARASMFYDDALREYAYEKEAANLFQEENQIDTPAFKKWFGDSKVVDENGIPLVVYRGDFRADLIKGRFKKNKSTSSRFYFTEDPEVASNYAKGKPYIEDIDYSTWYQVGKGKRKDNLSQAWYRLTTEQRDAVKDALLRARQDEETGEIIFGEADGGIVDKSHWEYELRQSHGNWLKAGLETWLNSGAIFDQEEKFGAILDKAGIPYEYLDPREGRPGVHPVYLSIQNPIDAANPPPEFVAAVRRWADTTRKKPKAHGVDAWDKDTRDPKSYADELEKDAKEHSQMWTTSIPDQVITIAQRLGYDGIKDKGGKYGGVENGQWIAFEPTQIKSATGNRGTFDPENPNILYQEDKPEIPRKYLFEGMERFVDDVASNKSKRVPMQIMDALLNPKDIIRDISLGQAGELSSLAPLRAMEQMDGKRFGLMKRWFLMPLQDADKAFNIELKRKKAEAKEVFKGLTAQDKEVLFDSIDQGKVAPTEKIWKAQTWLEKEYDDLLTRLNRERKAIGKDPIHKRQNYITHYQELSALQDIMQMIGMNMTEVPNSMLTISMYTKPNSPYFKYAKRRLGELTDRDAEKAYMNYIEPALKNIHYSRATKNGRDILEYKVKIPSEYEGGQTDNVSLFGLRYPNAYKYLTDYLNVLNGKRPIIDKMFPGTAAWSGVFRRFFAAGSIGGNLSTLFTQFASIRNTVAETGLFALKGQTLINTPEWYDFFAKNSRIGISRQYEPSVRGSRLLGSKTLAKTHEKISDLISVPVSMFDREMVGGSFLAGYFKGKSLGLNEEDAIRYGDDVAERTQASASPTDRPPINRGQIKTALGQFQTFVYNEWSQIRRDMINLAAHGEKTEQGYDEGLFGIKQDRGDAFARFFRFAVSTAIMSAIYETLGLPNPFRQEGATLPFTENKNSVINIVWQHILNSIPFVSSVRFGGPPLIKGAYNFALYLVGDERKRKEAARNLKGVGARLIPAGGQLTKTIRAYNAIVPSDGAWKRLRGLMFGPYYINMRPNKKKKKKKIKGGIGMPKVGISRKGIKAGL